MRVFLLAVLVVLVGAGHVQAGPISSVAARNNHADPILMSDALVNGVMAFSDRVDTTWQDVPPYMTGIDYIRTPDSDARNINFEMDVSLSGPAYLFMLVNNMTWGGGPVPWMVDGSFPYTFNDTGDDMRYFHPSYDVN